MLKYVIVTDNNLDSGVLKKVRYQVDTLNELGFLSELDIITQVAGKDEGTGSTHFFYFDRLEKTTVFTRLQRAKQIRNIISSLLASSGPDDVIYYRAFGSLKLSYFPITFFRPFHRCKILSEHNTIEYRELLLDGEYIPAFLNLFFGNLIIGQSNGIIGVTGEITRYWTKRLFYRSVPHCTSPNGIMGDSVPLRKTPAFDPGNLHILFVGNVSRWHGLDRMIQGIAGYRGSVRVQFHIVGDGDELDRLKKLKESIAPDADIHFHGFMSGHDLDAMFDRCHVAVGSLGIHRKGLQQTSELKAREYCARGIPYVIACGDADFPDDFPWIFRLNADESPVELEKVVAFARSVFSGPDPATAMRKYAQENLDWKVKIAKLKDFLETKILAPS
jgi:glycosyltransferase involved in cell wall biosynthesis